VFLRFEPDLIYSKFEHFMIETP